MTCAHVLGLIDAGPFADYPPAHLQAAGEHARLCATCGPALTSSLRLADELAALAHPEPPTHLAPAVLARIARLDTPHGSRAVSSAKIASLPSPWQERAAVCAGLAAACLVALSIGLSEGPAFDLTSPRIGGTTGLFGVLSTGPSWPMLAISLVFYVIALFVPLRSSRLPK